MFTRLRAPQTAPNTALTARALTTAPTGPLQPPKWQRNPPVSTTAQVQDPTASPAPDVPPVSEADLHRAVDFLRNHRNVLVITGAGCSTESNIPDYRGPRGAYTSGFKPMTHQQVRWLN